MLILLGLLLLQLSGGLATVSAYDQISVADGGSISGKVTISEGKPIPKGFNLITFADPVYCGRMSTGPAGGF